MAIYLKVMSGPDAGKTIEMQEGVTIGRSSNANFTFRDPKMSGRHVQAVNSPDGLILVDLGSKNGFRINGERSTKSPFISGASIRVGGTDFTVINEGYDLPPEAPKTVVRKREIPPIITPISNKTNTRAPAPRPTPPVEIDLEAETVATEEPKSAAPAPAAAPVKPPKPKWHEYFVQFIKSSAEKVKSKPRELRPFRRLVKLSVVGGIQTETVWTLGYGPRQIGPHSCDIVIEDPGAPPICFTVTPDLDSIVFTTDHPDKVKLNQKSVRTDSLKEGDVISFSSTSIQFGFEQE